MKRNYQIYVATFWVAAVILLNGCKKQDAMPSKDNYLTSDLIEEIALWRYNPRPSQLLDR